MVTNVISGNVFPVAQTRVFLKEITDELKWRGFHGYSDVIWREFTVNGPDKAIIRATAYDPNVRPITSDANPEAIRFIFDSPLEDMPLYLNDWSFVSPKKGGIVRKRDIAIFRLKCGV